MKEQNFDPEKQGSKENESHYYEKNHTIDWHMIFDNGIKQKYFMKWKLNWSMNNVIEIRDKNLKRPPPGCDEIEESNFIWRYLKYACFYGCEDGSK